MNKKPLSLALFLCLFMVNCTHHYKKPVTLLEQTINHDFKNITIPETKTISNAGYYCILENTTFDQAWDSLILVSIQKGFVVYSDKCKGILVFFDPVPYSFLVEEMPEQSNSTIIYGYIIEELYRSNQNKKRIKKFFTSLTNQANASTRWNYLFSNKNSKQHHKFGFPEYLP